MSLAEPIPPARAEPGSRFLEEIREQPAAGMPLIEGSPQFETVAAEGRLGWVAPGAPWPLVAVDVTCTDISRTLFHLDGQELRTRVTMVPIMMTTDAVIAQSDCLFYAAHRRQ